MEDEKNSSSESSSEGKAHSVWMWINYIKFPTVKWQTKLFFTDDKKKKKKKKKSKKKKNKKHSEDSELESDSDGETDIHSFKK